MLTEGFHRCLTSLYNCLSWTTTVARALLNLYSKRGIYGYSAPIVDPKRVGTRDWGFLPKIHHRNRHHISNIRYMYVVIVMVCRRFSNVFCIFTNKQLQTLLQLLLLLPGAFGYAAGQRFRLQLRGCHGAAPHLGLCVSGEAREAADTDRSWKNTCFPDSSGRIVPHQNKRNI